MTKPELSETLTELAKQIADNALSPTMLPADKLDAFKALTMYHLGLTKLSGKKPEKNEGGTFDDYRKQVEATATGRRQNNPAPTGAGTPDGADSD